MNSLEWIVLWEAFEAFADEAAAVGLYGDVIDSVETDLLARNPIPQPKKMEV